MTQKTDREYYKIRYRVVKNTAPIGGLWRCEVGCWVPDKIREKRDRFRVDRTVKVGTKEQCIAALPDDEFYRNMRLL